MSLLANLEALIQKDEQWVVAEIAKGWQALQTAEQTAAIDIENLFKWISTHQQDILNLFQGVLSDLATVGSIIPQAAPIIATATTAIDAATAAVDVLSKGVTAGSTPLSTIANAYHAVKTAQTAVTGVLKQATTKPAA